MPLQADVHAHPRDFLSRKFLLSLSDAISSDNFVMSDNCLCDLFVAVFFTFSTTSSSFFVSFFNFRYSLSWAALKKNYSNKWILNENHKFTSVPSPQPFRGATVSLVPQSRCSIYHSSRWVFGYAVHSPRHSSTAFDFLSLSGLFWSFAAWGAAAVSWKPFWHPLSQDLLWSSPSRDSFSFCLFLDQSPKDVEPNMNFSWDCPCWSLQAPAQRSLSRGPILSSNNNLFFFYVFLLLWIRNYWSTKLMKKKEELQNGTSS